jgi:hypothetical protein
MAESPHAERAVSPMDTGAVRTLGPNLSDLFCPPSPIAASSPPPPHVVVQPPRRFTSAASDAAAEAAALADAQRARSPAASPAQGPGQTVRNPLFAHRTPPSGHSAEHAHAGPTVTAETPAAGVAPAGPLAAAGDTVRALAAAAAASRERVVVDLTYPLRRTL